MKYTSSISRSITGFAIAVTVTAAFAAEPLVMQAMEEYVHGSDEIAKGEYEQAIVRSLSAVDRGGNKSRISAITNLCIAYTMTRQYEQATDYCDRAVDFGQYEWITLNNRAVLNYLKQDFQASVDDLNLAVATGRADWRATTANLRHVEVQIAAMKAYQIAVARSE